MTDELVAFLRARLDEDEQAARAATRGPWRWRGSSTNPHAALVHNLDAVDYDAVLHAEHELPGQPTAADAEHIARHDPARVLADVEAKRRIIDQCEEWLSFGPIAGWETDRGYEAGLIEAAEWMLRTLGLLYAEHPGYRAEWSPAEEESRG